MANDAVNEKVEAADEADIDKNVGDVFSISQEQALSAANELAEITPDAANVRDDIVKISLEKDEKKRNQIVEELRKKSPALFEGEMPELSDWQDDDDVALIDDDVPAAAGAPNVAAAAAPEAAAEAAEAGEAAEAAADGEDAPKPAAPTPGAPQPARPNVGRPITPPVIRVVNPRAVLARAAGNSPAPAPAAPATRRPAAKSLTRAQEQAIALVVADVLGLVMGLFGLRTSNQRIAQAVIAKTSRGWRYGLRNIGREFADAKKAGDRVKMAKLATGVVMGLCNVLSVKSVAQLIFGTMSKADWIKAGAIFLAQLAAWFGTAGMALTAQLGMLILGAVDLVRDSINLAQLMER